MGRIILARNPSSGLLAVLTRDFGLSYLSCPLARDAREDFFVNVDVLNEVLARGCRTDNVDGFLVTDFRKSGSVGDRCESLAAEDAVLAFIPAGSLTGLVGDFDFTALGDLAAFGDAEAFSCFATSLVDFDLSCVSTLGAG